MRVKRVTKSFIGCAMLVSNLSSNRHFGVILSIQCTSVEQWAAKESNNKDHSAMFVDLARFRGPPQLARPGVSYQLPPMTQLWTTGEGIIEFN